MALKPNQTITSSTLMLAATLLLLVSAPLPAARGQQPPGSSSPASCTASLLTSFTPCFSYLTNSTGTAAAAPTKDCCRSLAALVNASAGCACLVLTGAAPLGLGGLPAVNRTLAVSLPRACGSSTAVPLQCRDTTSTQTPAAPVPSTDAPSQLTPPLPPATPAAAPPAEQPTATAPVSQGQTRQRTVLPSSSARRRASARVPEAAAAALLLLAVGAALV